MKEQFVFSKKQSTAFFLGLAACLMLFFAAGSVSAQDYGLGTEGIKGGTLPPPGKYYVMYNQYYTSDKMTDRDGDDDHSGFDLATYAMVNRFVWITNKKILGADYGMNLIIPFVDVDINIDDAGIDKSMSGIGDINIEPLVLGWHKERWDAVLGLALFIPTGYYEENNAASIGKDHYTVMLTTGVTLYLDQDKLNSLSILTRYEKHFENRDRDITYGDDFSIDWGLGRQFGIVNAGISGYAHWQLTEDDGDDAVNKDVKDHLFGVGPEAQIDVPVLKGQVRLKYYKEFGGKDVSEGDAFWVTLVKSF